MRSVTDAEGRLWDVTVGRESWGALVLLFSLREGREFRTAPLAAETTAEAEREMAELSPEALRERLAASRPWEG